MEDNKNCTNCEWFESWHSISVDPLEDDDAGRCTNELNNTGINQELFVDYSYVCDKHKPEKSIWIDECTEVTEEQFKQIRK